MKNIIKLIPKVKEQVRVLATSKSISKENMEMTRNNGRRKSINL